MAKKKSIQRELPRKPEMRWWIERLAIDRPVEILACEIGVAIRRRESVVQELSVAGQHLGAGIEPGAGRDVDASVGALLDDAVRALRPVSNAAVPVVFQPGLLGGGRRDAEREDGDCCKQH